MNSSLLFLFALAGGIALGILSGRLAFAVLALIRPLDTSPGADRRAALLVLAAVGLVLGYLIQHLFDHWATLLGALAAFMHAVTPLLKSGD